MVNLPKLEDLDITGKRVIVRADLDVDVSEGVVPLRIKALKLTLDYLLGKQCKVIVIAHKGKPKGTFIKELSLREVSETLSSSIGKKIDFCDEVVGKSVKEKAGKLNPGEILVIENLRFDLREEEGDLGFAQEIASLGECYINESFAESHREVSSIVKIPELLPHGAGLRFIDEVRNLSRVLDNPKRPLVMVISGVKEDKLSYMESLSKIADKILIGGRLPDFIDRENSDIQLPRSDDEKIIVAQLNQDKEDITIRSIEKFEEEIGKGGTVVVSGPLGKFEDEGHRLGTERVFKATVANKNAFKVAGGGDTESAISILKMEAQFDWVSVGGGAMLEYLAKGTLPGIQALINS
jgi:phosphoglycerate kinase